MIGGSFTNECIDAIVAEFPIEFDFSPAAQKGREAEIGLRQHAFMRVFKKVIGSIDGILIKVRCVLLFLVDAFLCMYTLSINFFSADQMSRHEGSWQTSPVFLSQRFLRPQRAGNIFNRCCIHV